MPLGIHIEHMAICVRLGREGGACAPAGNAALLLLLLRSTCTPMSCRGNHGKLCARTSGGTRFDWFLWNADVGKMASSIAEIHRYGFWRP